MRRCWKLREAESLFFEVLSPSFGRKSHFYFWRNSNVTIILFCLIQLQYNFFFFFNKNYEKVQGIDRNMVLGKDSKMRVLL